VALVIFLPAVVKRKSAHKKDERERRTAGETTKKGRRKKRERERKRNEGWKKEESHSPKTERAIIKLRPRKEEGDCERKVATKNNYIAKGY